MTFLAREELSGLVDLCIEGDRSAQRKVYEHLYGKMLGVCLRYSKDIDEAKDMLQEGFVKVFINIHKYNKQGSFEGWVRRIIVNTSIDILRKQKHIHVSIDANEYDWLEDENDGEIEWNHALFREKERVMKKKKKKGKGKKREKKEKRKEIEEGGEKKREQK